MPIISGGGGGASLTPPVVITSTIQGVTALTVAGTTGQSADTLVVTDGDGGSVSAGGGGQSLLTVVGSDAVQNGLRVKAAAAQTGAALIVTDSANNDWLSVGGTGGATLSAAPVTGRTELQISTAALTYKDENGETVLDIEGGYISLGKTGEVVITPNNYFAITNHSAPADVDLDAGMCALWFDQTNGAAKLMIKAKQADGTVRSAAVALS